MDYFHQDLEERLRAIRESGLHRSLRRIDSAQAAAIQTDGRGLLNFSSNDYLGLATHPDLRHAASEAIARYGTGSGASRLICGSLAPHHELEAALARFKETEAALVFSSGYAAALGAVTALLDRNDVIVLDRLVHASLVDAARLSGARLRVFPHRDSDALDRILRLIRARPGSASSRILIVTESVFSMDGDVAPLRELVEIKERHGAWLLVDEAHATGLYGQFRRGLIDEFSLTPRVEIQLGTLGKALGASGGFICGSRPLIEFLINRARPFIFSTAPVPAAVAAATAAIRVVEAPEGKTLCDRLWTHVDQVRQGLRGTLGNSEFDPSDRCSEGGTAAFEGRSFGQSPILPIILGDESRAVHVAAQLLDQGILLPAIRHPTVPRGQARLRLTLGATHNTDQLDRLIHALRHILTGPARDTLA